MTAAVSPPGKARLELEFDMVINVGEEGRGGGEGVVGFILLPPGTVCVELEFDMVIDVGKEWRGGGGDGWIYIAPIRNSLR